MLHSHEDKRDRRGYGKGQHEKRREVSRSETFFCFLLLLLLFFSIIFLSDLPLHIFGEGEDRERFCLD